MREKRFVFSGLLAIGFSFFVLASAHASCLLIDENFDSYPTGSPPPGWIDSYSGPGSNPIVYTPEEAEALGVTIRVSNTVSVSPENSVHFLDTNSSVRSNIRKGSTCAKIIYPLS